MTCPAVLDRALACLTPAEAPQIRSHAFPSAAALAQPVREEVAWRARLRR
ncbi:MAG: hypothetical protein ACHQAQ_03675 [Hyphomicrobiales bacterium]